MIGCLRTRVHKQPIIALYFEYENELKFYNLEASPQHICHQANLRAVELQSNTLVPLVIDVCGAIGWSAVCDCGISSLSIS